MQDYTIVCLIMNTIVKIFGERVRSFRKKKKLSQERLAELAGVHPTYIGQVERAEKNCTIDAASKIAKALDIPLSELLKEPSKGELQAVILSDHEKEQIISDLVLKLSLMDTNKLRKRAAVISGIIELD